MSQTPVDIIIPTFHGVKVVCDVTHQPMLLSSVDSLVACGEFYPVRVIVVNNGDQAFETGDDRVKVVKMRTNVGWERGLVEGLKHSTAEYVIFANDDIFVPAFSRWFVRDFVVQMRSDKSIAGIGPSSNVVAGPQNIWFPAQTSKIDVAWLIGFCVMYRRSVLDEIGGVDDTLPGGDDLDLGIRCRRAGYRLIADRSHFVYHHGFKTGNAIHGGPEVEGGWNSPQMTARTNAALVDKHGLETVQQMFSPVEQPSSQPIAGNASNK